MFRRMLVLAVTVMVAVSVAPLHALGDATTLLGFAETYAAPDGTTRSHRGLDLAMDAGDVVETPLGGEVGFVGRVPGSDGGTVLAVTIVEGSRRLTLLPLEDARVERGDWIDAGTAIGTIAASGDPSSERPHVHVGLRQGEVYVDPAGLFSVAVPAPATKPEAAEAPSPATDGVGAGAAAESAVVSQIGRAHV